MGLFDNSNRQSGSWLPGVENCTNRAIPCGNPLCADEAMRSGGILGGARQETPASEQSMKHARSLARNCGTGNCPLEQGMTRDEALSQIRDIHAGM